MRPLSFITFLFFLVLPIYQYAQKTATVTLVFTEIRNSSGHMQYGVYRNEAEFKGKNLVKLTQVPKTTLKNGMLITEIILPEGQFGISGLDDENSNGVIDYNFVGMPKEGFCFSNYFHSGMSRPVFNQFKFEVKANTRMTLICRLRYI